MGRLIVERRYVGWVENTRLALTIEDYEKHQKRQDEKDGFHFRLFGWHERFVTHLEKCPYCGKSPRINALWSRKDYYDYKLVCCEKGMLNCGDWYPQLSRAGLDWNFRVRMQKGGPRRHCPHHKVASWDV